MELTLAYVMSQVFTIFNYVFLAATYYVKDRKKLLVINFISLLCNSMAYFLLKAYSGFAMCMVAVIRNIIFLLDKNKTDKIQKKDIVILVVLLLISVISAIFTYDGIFSLLSVVAAMLFTYAIWQKNTKTYKFLGIIVSILYCLYNIYVKSIFGVLLELVILGSSTSGYILEIKKFKNTSNTEE